jgi:hypothetical protein
MSIESAVTAVIADSVTIQRRPRVVLRSNRPPNGSLTRVAGALLRRTQQVAHRGHVRALEQLGVASLERRA